MSKIVTNFSQSKIKLRGDCAVIITTSPYKAVNNVVVWSDNEMTITEIMKLPIADELCTNLLVFNTEKDYQILSILTTYQYILFVLYLVQESNELHSIDIHFHTSTVIFGTT